MFFCFFFLYIYRTQSVDVKHERRSSTQQHRKNKRLIGVCRLRWSQDFWVDYEDISTEMTDAIQDEVNHTTAEFPSACARYIGQYGRRCGVDRHCDR